MIKINLSSDEPSHIGFEQTTINILDRLLEFKEITGIGITSRPALVAAIAEAQKDKFCKLDAELQRKKHIPPEVPEKQTVHVTPNIDEHLEEMTNSEAAYDMGVISKQGFFLPAMRSLLSEVDPEFKRLSMLLWISLDDLKKARQRLINQKKRE